MRGRICALCGRPGGFGFAALILEAEKAGVTLKFRHDSGSLRNTYLHNGCARQLQRLATARQVQKRVRERAENNREGR